VIAHALLQGVLAVLALYHLTIGVLSVFSFTATTRAAGALYGVHVVSNPQLRYAVRMLGLYAIALGALLLMAAPAPAAHREIVVVVACLQLARAGCRLFLQRELTDAFLVSDRRNALSAAVLVVQAALLLSALSFLDR